jgi:hypothetical protein
MLNKNKIILCIIEIKPMIIDEANINNTYNEDHKTSIITLIFISEF